MQKRTKINDLFGSMRMVLPEQHRRELSLLPKPDLDHDEIMAINYRLTESKRYNFEITVKYWREVSENGGEFLTVRGVAKSFDTIMKQVRIEEENGDWTWIDFGNIASVTD
ncbi:YolD-like family protein [Brevibacillus laterosporus]|uniref:YolD-like family protein n=2 Tax=Brevibacillus laterosporus TaxID=1465 RepID=UPI0013158F5E|nr:YolD-like family protein [Brevibacillus laterosporus]